MSAPSSAAARLVSSRSNDRRGLTLAHGLKAIVLRYGGMRLYRACIPFALGLILGDYVVPTLWSFWGR